MSSLGDACIGCQGDDDDDDTVVGVVGLLPLIGEKLFSWVYMILFDLAFGVIKTGFNEWKE